MHTEQCHILQNSFPFYPTPLAVIGSTLHHTNLIPLMPALLDLSPTALLIMHLPSHFPSLPPLQHSEYQPEGESCRGPPPSPPQPLHPPSYFPSLPPPHYQPPQLPRDPPDNYPLVVRLTDIPRVSNYALSPRMRRAS